MVFADIQSSLASLQKARKLCFSTFYQEYHQHYPLNNYKNSDLNDLLKPCQTLYSELKISDNEFLSGSGSSKFKLKI